MFKSFRNILILFPILFIPFAGFSQEHLREAVLKLTEVSSDRKYGYSPKKPIMVGSTKNVRHYLNALLGPHGEKVSYMSMGSCCPFHSENASFGQATLDKYRVWYPGMKKPVILYLNGFDYEPLKSPRGFTFVTEATAENPVE